MQFVQVLCIVLVSVAMALSLVHALELPGKLRLDERTYRAVQAIYYPGFTIGGAIGELGGALATVVLLFLTPWASSDFVLTLAALACLVGMHAIYWGITHPINRVWLSEERLGPGGVAFFATGAARVAADWTVLRGRWERSHVARAALAFAAFLMLLIAAVTPT